MFKRLFVYLSLILILTVSVVLAGKFKTEKFSFKPDKLEKLEVNINLGAGEFELRVEDIEDVARALVEYNESRVDVFSDYDERGTTGIVDFESETRRKFNIDTEDNIWDITLSEKYPTELNVDIGACESKIDLGGLPLTYLDFDAGAADVEVVFSRPNPERVKDVKFDAGAVELKVKKLGNANFDRLSFEGGAGDFDIDFSGEYRGISRAKISIGLGSAQIRVPSDLPVRIEADDSFLSTVEFHHEERKFLEGDDYYETSDFRDSDIGLDLEVSVGLGSVEIIFED